MCGTYGSSMFHPFVPFQVEQHIITVLSPPMDHPPRDEMSAVLGGPLHVTTTVERPIIMFVWTAGETRVVVVLWSGRPKRRDAAAVLGGLLRAEAVVEDGRAPIRPEETEVLGVVLLRSSLESLKAVPKIIVVAPTQTKMVVYIDLRENLNSSRPRRRRSITGAPRGGAGAGARRSIAGAPRGGAGAGLAKCLGLRHVGTSSRTTEKFLQVGRRVRLKWPFPRWTCAVSSWRPHKILDAGLRPDEGGGLILVPTVSPPLSASPDRGGERTIRVIKKTTPFASRNLIMGLSRNVVLIMGLSRNVDLIMGLSRNVDLIMGRLSRTTAGDWRPIRRRERGPAGEEDNQVWATGSFIRRATARSPGGTGTPNKITGSGEREPRKITTREGGGRGRCSGTICPISSVARTRSVRRAPKRSVRSDVVLSGMILRAR